jgi:hypothetical protein
VINHRKRLRIASLAALLSLSLLPTAYAADGDEKEKTKLIDQLIPKSVQDIVSQAGEVVGLYTGVSGYIDVALGALQALGILEPDAGPSIGELFADLSKKLDSLAGALDWKIGAVARDERYGKAMSAYYSLMHAMNAGGAESAIIARADDNSVAVLAEIEGPGESAFSRLSQETVTDGGWRSVIERRPEVVNGQVFDWRLGVPEFAQYAAIRTQVIAVLDPNFKANGEFHEELEKHRDFARSLASRIQEGVTCGFYTTPSCGGCDGIEDLVQVCADVQTGTSVWYTQSSAINDPNHTEETLRNELIAVLPIAQLNQVADDLDRLANP